jgi:large subunit ribosomal protein L29
MKTKEIRELAKTELEKTIRDTREELLNLRLRKQTGQVERTNELQSLRRDIARMETIHGQKMRAETAAAAES